MEEDALFLQSESEFFSDQYPKAHDTIGGLLKKYPNTRHLDTAVAREQLRQRVVVGQQQIAEPRAVAGKFKRHLRQIHAAEIGAVRRGDRRG